MAYSYRTFVRLFVPILSWAFFVMPSYGQEKAASSACALPAEKLVALTFDDGPSPRTTPEILKILKHFNAKATFFVVGKNAQRFKSYMADIHHAGHELGNHSYSHPVLTRVSAERVRSEMEVTSKIIAETTGGAPIWFRPPYGSVNNKVRGIARDLGMKTIIWTEDPRDWSRTATAESIERKVMATLHSGSVVLMHDNHSATIEALPIMMQKMQDQGYRFVTVDELKSQESSLYAHKASVCKLDKNNDLPVYVAPVTQ